MERSGDQRSLFADCLPSMRFFQRSDGKICIVFNFSGFFGADFDSRACPGRFKDSVRHTQVLQPVARSDQRIGASTNDRDKMFDLRREWVGSLKLDCLGLKRFEPGAVFLPRSA
jgi:hypothetical protein